VPLLIPPPIYSECRSRAQSCRNDAEKLRKLRRSTNVCDTKNRYFTHIKGALVVLRWMERLGRRQQTSLEIKRLNFKCLPQLDRVSHLNKTNVFRPLPEALSAHVKVILADDSALISCNCNTE
jgi:hypothetical protein